MYITYLKLKNWRNFLSVETPIRERMFIVGPNASGKSNLMDAFRFLRDLSKTEGGGLQKAVRDRGGVSKIRCLEARKDPVVSLTVSISKDIMSSPVWEYSIGFKQESRGYRRVIISHETVKKDGTCILDRPKKEDNQDPDLKTQSYIEQLNSNKSFREISKFFQTFMYIHLVPQLLRYADSLQGRQLEDDPFGQGFLERIADKSPKTRRSRLQKIEQALQIAVPQLEQLQFEKDPHTGRPHLVAKYKHWRPNAGWQKEDQFSDGTLRMIALFWSLLEGESLLLLEEPELSLHTAIIRQLPPFIHNMRRKKSRQVIISTHSSDLLMDSGIDGREVILLNPSERGTIVNLASDIEDIKTLLESGMSVGDVVVSRTDQMRQKSLFDVI